MSNDKDVIRIGRGIPTPPPAAPPRRRTAVLLVAGGGFLGAAILAVLLMFGGGIFGDQAGSQVPMPTQSTPNLKVLDVQATCVLLIPSAQDGANAVLALAAKPDGSTVDWPKVDKTIRDLKLVQEVAAPELRDDIGQQIATLSQLAEMRRTGNNMTFDLRDFRASGLRVGARCAPYAR